jgi:hypothetical protein
MASRTCQGKHQGNRSQEEGGGRRARYLPPPATSRLLKRSQAEGVSSIQQGRRVTLGGPRSLDLALSIEVAEVSFGLLFRQHRSAQFA